MIHWPVIVTSAGRTYASVSALRASRVMRVIISSFELIENAVLFQLDQFVQTEILEAVLLGFSHEVHVHAVDAHRDHVAGGAVRIAQSANLLQMCRVCSMRVQRPQPL